MKTKRGENEAVCFLTSLPVVFPANYQERAKNSAHSVPPKPSEQFPSTYCNSKRWASLLSSRASCHAPRHFDGPVLLSVHPAEWEIYLGLSQPFARIVKERLKKRFPLIFYRFHPYFHACLPFPSGLVLTILIAFYHARSWLLTFCGQGSHCLCFQIRGSFSVNLCGLRFARHYFRAVVGKHFLRRATLQTLLLPESTHITLIFALKTLTKLFTLASAKGTARNTLVGRSLPFPVLEQLRPLVDGFMWPSEFCIIVYGQHKDNLSSFW